MEEIPARDAQQAITELTEAVRKEEQRKAEIASLLSEIKDGLNYLHTVEERLLWVEKLVNACYDTLHTLVRILAVDIGKDRQDLNGVQKAIAEHALEREAGQLQITAARDAVVGIAGDVKSEEKYVGKS